MKKKLLCLLLTVLLVIGPTVGTVSAVENEDITDAGDAFIATEQSERTIQARGVGDHIMTESEDNGDKYSANSIENDYTVYGYSGRYDTDYYKFRLEEKAEITVTLSATRRIVGMNIVTYDGTTLGKTPDGYLINGTYQYTMKVTINPDPAYSAQSFLLVIWNRDSDYGYVADYAFHVSIKHQHEHDYDYIEHYTSPTCTEQGYSIYECKCGSISKDIRYWDALGHKETVMKGTPATCTQPGKTEGKYCSRCNEVLTEQVEIPALDHNVVIDAAIAATCMGTGMTEGKHCSVCQTVLIPQSVVPLANHNYVVDDAVAPTCSKPGLSVGSHCSVCQVVLIPQTEVAATGHKEVTHAAAAPTCMTAGKTEGKYCSVCGEVLVEQKVIPALGHAEVTDKGYNPTCTKTGFTEGKHCSVCNEILVKQEVIPATGHTEVVDPAVEPTCTEPGKTEGKHCLVCDEVLAQQEVISALGHTYENGFCTLCGAEKPPYVPGDLDDSGTIDTYDALKILYYINGRETLTEEQKLAANVVGEDDTIDVWDVLQIIYFINHRIDHL